LTTCDDTPRLTSQQKHVVIVDDSAALRDWLRIVLEQDCRLKVVGEASDANDARRVIKALKPDVITLDIEMPGMNGLDFLARLMELHPMPVVMMSSATIRGSDAAITALSLGAVDYIVKPQTSLDAQAVSTIGRRVFSAACSTVQPRGNADGSPSHRLPAQPVKNGPIIVIGASTGGVTALERVLSDLHADGPPVVIVQHMPAQFLVSFSKLLNRNLAQTVNLADENTELVCGQIVLAPACGAHTVIARRDGVWRCGMRPDLDNALHCPSVDMLFTSAAPFGADVIGVILTGLGQDGAQGLLKMHNAGAQTIGQDAASSVIYGMPRVAWEWGAVQKQMPLGDIGAAVNAAVAHHAVHLRSDRSAP